MTIRKIERAESESIRNKTKSQLERVLEWRPGLVDRILDGTATEDEIAERTNYVFGGDSGTGSEHGAAHANLGAMTAAGTGTAHAPTVVTTSATATASHSGVLEGDDGQIFDLASRLVPLLMGRKPSTPASRAVVSHLLDLMRDLIDFVDPDGAPRRENQP